MDKQFRKELKVFVDLLQGLRIVIGQPDFLPQISRSVRAFNCFHIQKTLAYENKERKNESSENQLNSFTNLDAPEW